jgi:hypothetical protein
MFGAPGRNVCVGWCVARGGSFGQFQKGGLIHSWNVEWVDYRIPAGWAVRGLGRARMWDMMIGWGVVVGCASTLHGKS